MIATVTEDGGTFTIWDETGNWTAHISKFSDRQLVGFTSATVSIRDGSGDTLIFDENGNHIKTVR